MTPSSPAEPPAPKSLRAPPHPRESRGAAPETAVRFFFVAAGAVTLARLAALFASDINLGPDETQYWFWSLTPAFGYFSKPPMIAWFIAATTAIFGDAEWAVRLSAPLLHLGTSLLLYVLGRQLYGARAGAFAGLVWVTLPGVSLSAMVISTDALLLFFWSAALIAYFRLARPDSENPPRAGAASLCAALGLGIAFGLGFLSKYAMIYFIPGAVLAWALSRARPRASQIALAGAAALALIAPNIAWNARNDFQTLAHTAANADWSRDFANPAALLEFLGAQFGVFGPVTFALLIVGVAQIGGRIAYDPRRARADLSLLGFAAPPLLIVSAQAFISRAHANWAAAAFPAAAVLVAAWADRSARARAFKGGVAFNAAAGAVFMIGVVNFAFADALGLSNVVKRVRGWPEQVAEITRRAGDYDAILIDDRELMGAVLYYGRRSDAPVVAWNSNNRVEHHYEAFNAFDPGRLNTLLFVTPNADAVAVRGRFERIRRLGEATAELKGGRYRRLYLFALEGYILGSEPKSGRPQPREDRS